MGSEQPGAQRHSRRARPTAEDVQAAIADDPVEPGAERLTYTVEVEPCEGAQEGVLGGVLGRRRLSQHSQRHVVDLLLMSFEQRFGAPGVSLSHETDGLWFIQQL